MKYKEQVKGIIDDLKQSIDWRIKSFEVVDTIKQAIKKNVDAFGPMGNALPHLEKAREAALKDIKYDIEWLKHLVMEVEYLVDLEEESEVREHLHIDRPCHNPNPELFDGLLIKPTIEEEVGK